ncbi:MAG: transposase, partial [Sulfurimonas sp.]|nr:transposase [Sulfurimonas sp.]
MGIYKEGLHRGQQLLLPPSLDDLVGQDNMARAIEEYVNVLDISSLNIKTKKDLIKDGQPAFHPRLLLKIYIYGYLNKVRSSRKLETEIKRNIEMMWLTQGLTPSYKTIANFRKDNPKALQTIFKEFSILIKNLKLITGDLVAIDGAYLRANASKNTLI